MKKLSKKRIQEFADLFTSLDDLQCTVEEAINEYNSAIQEFNDLMEEVVCEIEGYMGDRSDKWHESDKVEQYEEWMEFFQEEKEEADLPYFEHGTLDELPIEVEAAS
mgnify:CR=1 FL=1